MDIKRVSSLIIIWICVSSLGLSACGADSTATAPPAEGQIIVKDALAREVTFSQPPQRIAVAGKGTLTVADTIYMFPEAQERVAAVSRARQNVGDFLRFADPTFDQKTLLEVQAGPEQISTVNPDVAVLKSYLAQGLGRSLEELHIPVIYVDLETPEQYFKDLVTLGQLFGNPERAQEIEAFYRTRLDRIATAVEDIEETAKPRILIIYYNAQGGEVAFNVSPASWMQTLEAELVGAVPVWTEAAQGGGWTVVNFEQIAAWDPAQIFVIHYEGDAAQVVDELMLDPQWQILQAVQAGKVYGFPADIFSWDQPDPRWILGLTWLATKVHPDRFPDLDMTQEVYQFFGQMYGMDDAAIKTHILPVLKGDLE